MKKIFYSVLLTCSVLGAFSQSKHPENYFRSPLDIPLLLAGNFGEIRSNHFHGGLDMKTQGVQGMNIYSAAEGYVSRIKVSPYGYGKTLYITHPNGYTTVYGHLKKYSDKIESYIKKNQYKKQSYSIQLFPYRNQIKVEKGEVVALSGNTGGSSGPHLHFEIRNAITGYPVNPLLFGFDIVDSIKPVIRGLRVYPLNNASHVNKKDKPSYFTIFGSKGNYRIEHPDPIPVYGEIGFGVEVYDFLNGSHNKCGIYSIELLKDGKRLYYHEMESYGFHENRFINSHVDYYEFKRKGKHVQKSFIAPNNKLGIYKEAEDRGIVPFYDSTIHNLEYIIKDSYGNTSRLTMRAKGVLHEEEKKEIVEKSKDSSLNALANSDTHRTGTAAPYNNPNSGGSNPNVPESIYKAPVAIEDLMKVQNEIKEFRYQLANTFETADVTLKLVADQLYEDLLFEYKVTDTIKGAFTPTHHMHNEYVPVHGKFNLSIRTDEVPERLKEKALIARVRKNGRTYYHGGSFDGNEISTRTEKLGAYTVLVDTIPPKVRGVNIFNGKDMSKTSTIKMSMVDNLSGIYDYDATIDGQWILMEYEPKQSRLTFDFADMDKFFTKMVKDEEDNRKHKFELTVVDNRGNKKVVSYQFKR